jgi:hypothetical protein
MPCQSILNLSLHKSQGEKGYLIFHIANVWTIAILSKFYELKKKNDQ